ncbi:nodulin MtN21 /EamA-like transporter family protein [Striga asiatica]|uniref:Nodulin MtN21 /EamA-like transporter family protein n=1 Tax=Striga asiatica TaxID=4170 RepID=A0A5A7PT23_STRAF|nr:nodulin MtN21 /EamA-like transporter family protein [Striga asiatica]
MDSSVTKRRIYLFFLIFFSLCFSTPSWVRRTTLPYTPQHAIIIYQKISNHLVQLFKYCACHQHELKKKMARGGGAGDHHRYCYRELVPFTALVAMECTNVGLNTLFKFATRHQMSRHVFLVYAYAVAALVLVPSPFFARRSRALPSLNFSIMLKIFLLGIVGYASQIMGYTGINYGSPTLASAMSNLAPAFTFVLAIIFRMEKVTLSSTSSRAKIVGTIVSITGAFIVTFYKGPSISATQSTHPISLNQSLYSSQSNWIIGSLFLSVEYLLVPVWYIIQAHIMKEYPAELTVVFFYTSCVSILAAIVGLFAEPDSSKWKIGPNVALVSVLCSGLFGCCINNAVHTWALHLRGPVYVAIIIGAAIIAIGFYTVMWGKTKEEYYFEFDVDYSDDLESSAETKRHPLLQSYKNRGSTKEGN